MWRRSVLFRAMLWTLTAAAAGGALIFLIDPQGTGWRVLGALLALLPVVGVVVVALLLGDRGVLAPAAVYTACAIAVASWPLVVLAIWSEVLWAWGTADSVMMTAAAYVGLSVPALACAVMIGGRGGTVAGLAGVAICGLVFVTVLVEIWTPFDADTLGWSTLCFGLPTVLCLIGVENGNGRHWRSVGVGAAIVGVIAVNGIPNVLDSSPHWIVIPASVAGLCAFVNLMMLAPLQTQHRWVRMAGIGMAALTAVSLSTWSATSNDWRWRNPWPDNRTREAVSEVSGRVAGAGTILTAVAALAIVVLSRLTQRPENDDAATPAHLPTQISLTCPRCGESQTLPVGEAACRQCRLRIATRLEEPRCPQCGYLVSGIASQRCPECGAALSEPAPTATPSAPPES